MNNFQFAMLNLLIILSAVLLLAPGFYAAVKYFYNLRKSEKTVFTHSLNRKLMFISVLFVGSVLLLRMAVLYYSKISGENGDIGLIEIFTDSFLHALKSLGVDDNFLDLIDDAKKLIRALAPGNKIIEFFFVIHTAIVNIATPLVGGALIFNVLTSVFPKLKLRMFFWRKHVYISELNDRSLALAKSIYHKERRFLKKPLIVFTDTYLDNENEKSTENHIEAKKLGAVCVNDDLSHLKIYCSNRKEFFLMDENESSNIRTLSELCSEDYCSAVKNSQIYIFYEDDSYALIEKKIYSNIKNILEKKGEEASLPVFIRVKEFENLIMKLLSEKPLIEPLLGRKTEKSKEEKDYNLTIIGSGRTGMQMLLSSTWAGQFYGYNLKINVVSFENQQEFVDRLNKINPEIIKSTQEKSSLLKIYEDEKNDEFSAPYFSLRYGMYDLEKADIAEMKCADIGNASDEFSVFDSDYIFIALGKDEFNMSVAEEFERKLSILREGKKPIVVAFVVYNKNFCSILSNSKSMNSEIIMHPFGSIDEMYNYENITMIQNDAGLKSVDKIYSNILAEQRVNQENRYKKKLYESLSSQARAVHLKYRIFSAYHYLYCNTTTDKYKPVTVYDRNTYVGYRDEILSRDAGEDVLQYLAWLEHRRWNAYLRSVGFSYRKMQGKDVYMKIHGCLVECSKTKTTDNQKDMLDAASEMNGEDMKIYDFPMKTDMELIDNILKTE